MNDNQELQSNNLPADNQINGAWIDVKLCTVAALKRRQKKAERKNKNGVSETNISSLPGQNELYYGD